MKPKLSHSFLCSQVSGWGRGRQVGRKGLRGKRMMMYMARSNAIKTICVLTCLVSASGPSINVYLSSTRPRIILEYKKCVMVSGPG